MATRGRRRDGKERDGADRSTAGGPPAFDLRLGRHLGMLALFNVIPLIGGLWVWWQLSHPASGAHFRQPVGREWLWVCAVVLIACMILALSCWLVMPFGRWLRDYPTWHYRHGAKALWALPMLGGWLGWLGLYLVGAATTLACVLVVGTGLWRLYELMK